MRLLEDKEKIKKCELIWDDTDGITDKDKREEIMKNRLDELDITGNEYLSYMCDRMGIIFIG